MAFATLKGSSIGNDCKLVEGRRAYIDGFVLISDLFLPSHLKEILQIVQRE